jgi:hypothetical protein
MKKIFKFLAGIVFLMAILVIAGFSIGDKPNNSKKVEVYLKAVTLDGRMHLEMYNGRHPDRKVIDSLYTDVQPGYIVLWKKAEQSGIRKVNQIRPMKENGRIFRDEAREVRGKFRYEIPSDAKAGTEKYEIVFKDLNNDTWTIDPYLRISHN